MYFNLAGIVLAKQAFPLSVLNLVGPEDGHKMLDDFPPVLKWSRLYNIAGSSEPQEPDVFKVTIFTRLQGNGPQPSDHIIHEEDGLVTTRYIVPVSILTEGKTYYWYITAFKGTRPVAQSERRTFLTENFCIVGQNENKDADCDGISDLAEEYIGTNPQHKTVFMRPKKQQSDALQEWVYWNKFMELFPDPRGKGFASIKQLSCPENPPFPCKPIEIIVIGAQNHTYSPFNDFYYNPSNHTVPDHIMVPDNKLPCNILEIEYYDEKDDCRGSCKNNYNVTYKGHTYLLEMKTYNLGDYEPNYIWAWDQKAKTDGAKNLQKYPIVRLFKFPLDNYFEEGAYGSVKFDEIPSINDTVQCPPLNNTDIHCNLCNIDCEKIGPGNMLNIKCDESQLVDQLSQEEQEAYFYKVFSETPDHTLENDSVEFTPIVYYNSENINEAGLPYKKGQIKYIPSKIYSCDDAVDIIWDADNNTKIMKPYKYIDSDYKTVQVRPYTKDDVLKRTIVHEIGHALMVGNNSDHCYNPLCIMYSYTKDWEPRDFGPPCGKDEDESIFYCCDHRPGGGRDIRRLGGVYNAPH